MTQTDPPRPAAPASAGRHALNGLTGLAAMGCVVGTLVHRLGSVVVAQWVADASFALFIVMVLRRLPRAAQVYLTLILVLCALALIRSGQMPASLLRGLSSAAFLSSVFMAVGFLGVIAGRSRTILRCGTALVGQPPGRRYAAMTAGGHVLAILLNIGALTLLGTMVERAVAQETDSRIRGIRHQRMLLALLRAFCAVVLWSPTSIGIAFVISLLPGLQWGDIGALGVGMAAFLMLLGWGMDRVSFPRPKHGGVVADGAEAGFPAADALRLLAIILAVFGCAFGLRALTGSSLVAGIILGAPLVGLTWRAFQEPGRLGDRLAAAGVEGSAYVWRGIGRLAPEVSIIGLAAVLGAVASDFVPVEAARALLESAQPPSWTVPAAAAGAVVLAGQAGLNPVLIIPLLVPSFRAIVEPGTEVLLAVACLGGWTLCLNSSPFVSTSLIVARHAPVPARVIGHRWNGLYTLLGLTALIVYLGLLDAWGVV